MYILRKLCIYLLNCDKLFREWGGGLGKAEATLLVYQNMTLPIYVRSDISVYIKKNRFIPWGLIHQEKSPQVEGGEVRNDTQL